MLTSLYIRNFALIDELHVDFHDGLSILTGQTGAGKSIIIGALNMVLGERADTELIRQGADKAIAEATFRIDASPSISWILRENEIEQHSELILRREIRAAGSRAFINDTPVSIQVLKSLGDLLVDLHGQHEHQLLLRDEHHRNVLDSFSSVASLQKAYHEQWTRLSALKRQLEQLRSAQKETAEKITLFRFQLRELEEAKLMEGEEEEREAEMKILDSAEELQMHVQAITQIGQSDDGGLLDLLTKVRQHLQDLAGIEPRFESYLEELNTARISIQEMLDHTDKYGESIEFNPARLEELRRRQSDLLKLQKKYTRTHPELIALREELKGQLSALDSPDASVEGLEQRIADEALSLTESALKLHEARTIVGEKLSRKIVETLEGLGMPHVQFKVSVEWLRDHEGWIQIDGQATACLSHGCDDVRFLISTNRGEEPKALSKIASGGEISRVMLALKSILASEQTLPVMIFDEIDTGISGSVSEKVGRMMRHLSRRCQIIAITHQPQIASQAHTHYRVEKSELADRTVSRIVQLGPEEHIREVASLMSGEEITESSLQSAREMIARSEG